jgi:CRISPR-associated endonuclease Csy4
MNHYLEINILDDPEFAKPTIFSEVFTRLHRFLVAHQSQTQLAVSFPRMVQAKKSLLGDSIRLFGSKEALVLFQQRASLDAIKDFISIGAIQATPNGCKHRGLRRVQVQSGVGRMRRRLMKRHGLSEAEAEKRIPDHAAQRLDLPFVQMKSGSTGQPFLLFFELSDEVAHPVAGEFNTYGLSGVATIPIF